MSLMLGNLFQQLYTFVDALVVGRCVNADALAALGATDRFIKKAIFSGYFIAVVGAICLTTAGQIMIYPGLRLLRTPDEIVGLTRQYLAKFRKSL